MKTVLIFVPDGNLFVIDGLNFGYNRRERHRYHHFHHCIKEGFIFHSRWSLALGFRRRSHSWVIQRELDLLRALWRERRSAFGQTPEPMTTFAVSLVDDNAKNNAEMQQ